MFRRSAFDAIGRLRRHAAGEVMADWPWLLHLAALGRFLRVPEVLWEKRMMRTSLSRGWPSDLRTRRAVRAAALAAIGRTPLPAHQRLAAAAWAMSAEATARLAKRLKPRRRATAG